MAWGAVYLLILAIGAVAMYVGLRRTGDDRPALICGVICTSCGVALAMVMYLRTGHLPRGFLPPAFLGGGLVIVWRSLRPYPQDEE